MTNRRDQQLLEGPIEGSNWRYRTARIHGVIEFFGPGGAQQCVEVAGAPIVGVHDLHHEGREVLVAIDQMEWIVHRDDDERWYLEIGRRAQPPTDASRGSYENAEPSRADRGLGVRCAEQVDPSFCL